MKPVVVFPVAAATTGAAGVVAVPLTVPEKVRAPCRPAVAVELSLL